MNWGEGYRQGYRAGAKKAIEMYRKDMNSADRLYMLQDLMNQIGKTADGAPSQYAVANKCCGGIDAHNAGCRG